MAGKNEFYLEKGGEPEVNALLHTHCPVWRMRDGEPGGVAWPVIVPNQPSSALGTVNSLPERHLAASAAESVSVSSSGKFPVLLSLVATTDERELQNPWRKAASLQDAQRLRDRHETHARACCPDSGPGSSASRRARVICRSCKQRGHIKRDCPHRTQEENCMRLLVRM